MMEQYGNQGNQGQYGQGQYDSEGQPDTSGLQAQEIVPDHHEQKEMHEQSDSGMINGTNQERTENISPAQSTQHISEQP